MVLSGRGLPDAGDMDPQMDPQNGPQDVPPEAKEAPKKDPEDRPNIATWGVSRDHVLIKIDMPQLV